MERQHLAGKRRRRDKAAVFKYSLNAAALIASKMLAFRFN